MRKMRCMLTALVMLALVISAPAYAETLEGNWVCVSYIDGGTTYDADGMFEIGCSIEFYETEAVLTAEQYTEPVGYEYDGGTVTFKNSQLFTSGTVDGSYLYVDYYGVTLVFAGPDGGADIGGASSGEFVGTWKMTYADVNGTRITADKALDGNEMYIYLYDDFTARLISGDSNIECGWRQSGDGEIEIYDESSSYIATINDGVLYLDSQQSVIFICERSVENVAFIGTWEIDSVRIGGVLYTSDQANLGLGLLTVDEGGELTFSFKFENDDDVTTGFGTWSALNDTTASGTLDGADITLKIEQNTLTMTDNEGDEYVFTIYEEPVVDGQIEGRWELESVMYSGVSLSPRVLNINITLIFMTDGTMEARYADGTKQGTWSANTDGTFTVDYEGAQGTFTVADDKLTNATDDDTVFIFAKGEDGGNAEFAGHWEFYSAVVNGEEKPKESFSIDFEMDLYEDGTVFLKSNDDEAYGNWEITEGNKGVLFDNTDRYDIMLEDGILSLESDDITIKFIKSDAVIGTQNSGFEGVWTLATIMSGDVPIDAVALGVNGTLKIKSDRTFEIDTANNVSSGSWTYSGTTATLTATDGSRITAELSSGSLMVTTSDGVVKYYTFQSAE